MKGESVERTIREEGGKSLIPHIQFMAPKTTSGPV